MMKTEKPKTKRIKTRRIRRKITLGKVKNKVGVLVKATPSKLGDQFIYRATYILIKPE